MSKLEDTLPYLFGLPVIVEGDDPLVQMDAQVRKRRTLDAIKRIVLRGSLNQPLMVIFEDLYWIDDETQAFLNLLADSMGTAASWVTTTADAATLTRLPTLWSGRVCKHSRSRRIKNRWAS